MRDGECTSQACPLEHGDDSPAVEGEGGVCCNEGLNGCSGHGVCTMHSDSTTPRSLGPAAAVPFGGCVCDKLWKAIRGRPARPQPYSGHIPSSSSGDSAGPRVELSDSVVQAASTEEEDRPRDRPRGGRQRMVTQQVPELDADEAAAVGSPSDVLAQAEAALQEGSGS